MYRCGHRRVAAPFRLGLGPAVCLTIRGAGVSFVLEVEEFEVEEYEDV